MVDSYLDNIRTYFLSEIELRIESRNDVKLHLSLASRVRSVYNISSCGPCTRNDQDEGADGEDVLK